MLAPERGKSGLPLQRQLYESVRTAILSGSLPPGTRLPSTRALAGDWKLGRNTVVGAFEQLVAEGYLESQTGSGTYVSHQLPEEFLQVHRLSREAKLVGTSRQRRSGLSRRGRRIADIRGADDPLRPKAFSPGVPAVDSFPVDTWRRLTSRRIRRISRQLLCYQDPKGYPPLRKALAAYLGTARGVRCDWEQILIVSSSQQALDLSARLLLDPGDSVWIEEPGYTGARGALIAAGADLAPIPVDSQGIKVDWGIRQAPDARLIYITPSHQYPLGATLNLPRRMALLEWASRSGAWILEDDYDSEYRYAERPLSSLQGLDETGCVIYIGTFSKVLFPSLRLAYMVVPPDLVDAFQRARNLNDGHSPSLAQSVLTDFIEEGHFTAHLRRMRNLYYERQEALVQAAESRLQGVLDVQRSPCGMHVTGILADGHDDVRLSRDAAAQGLDAAPLSFTYLRDPTKRGFILGYCCIPRDEIERGVETMARILDDAALLE